MAESGSNGGALPLRAGLHGTASRDFTRQAWDLKCGTEPQADSAAVRRFPGLSTGAMAAIIRPPAIALLPAAARVVATDPLPLASLPIRAPDPLRLRRRHSTRCRLSRRARSLPPDPLPLASPPLTRCRSTRCRASPPLTCCRSTRCARRATRPAAARPGLPLASPPLTCRSPVAAYVAARSTRRHSDPLPLDLRRSGGARSIRCRLCRRH
jgi:hypothetical protein